MPDILTNLCTFIQITQTNLCTFIQITQYSAAEDLNEQTLLLLQRDPTLLPDFVKILKYSFQNFCQILKKCIWRTGSGERSITKY